MNVRGGARQIVEDEVGLSRNDRKERRRCARKRNVNDIDARLVFQ